MKRWLLLLLLSARSVCALEPVAYSLEELDTLVAKKEYAEALLHLPDVLPANRSKEWEKIVEKTAVGQLRATAAEDSVSDAMAMAEEMRTSFPSLQHSTAFEETRNDIGFRGFETCFESPKDSPRCATRLMEFIKTGKNVPALAFRAGQLISRKYAPQEAFPFFEKAIGHLTRKGYCPNEDVKRSVVAIFSTKDEALFKRGVRFAQRECWDAIQPELVKEIERAPAGYFVTRTCIVLLAKKALPPSVKGKCTPH